MAVKSPSIFCRKCHYPLDGLREHRCPECGEAFLPGDPASYLTCVPTPRAIVGRMLVDLAWVLVVGLLIATPILASWCYAEGRSSYRPFEHRWLYPVIFLSVCAFVCGAILFVLWITAARRVLPFVVLAILFAVAMIAAIVAGELGAARQRAEVQEGKRYAHRIVTELEDYRKKHGQYPASLSLVASSKYEALRQADKVHLLKYKRSDPQRFVLSYGYGWDSFNYDSQKSKETGMD